MTSAPVVRSSFVICCLPLLVWTPCAGQGTHRELELAVERYVKAFNSGDASALADLYLQRPDVASVGDGEIARGRRAVSNLIDRVFAGPGSPKVSVDSVTVMLLGEEAGLAFFRYRLEPGGDAGELAGAMTLVMVRTPEGWRVAHDHTSTLAGHVESSPAAASVEGGPSSPIRETRECNVTRVIDADTIECGDAGRVRLIGIDAPERDQAPYGAMATRAAMRMVPPGTRVELEGDVESRDRYGRTLAYVWLDGTMINWLLVREGWAVLLTYPPNVQYVDWFVEAQREAREERTGLWEIDAFDCLPVDHRRGRCD